VRSVLAEQGQGLGGPGDVKAEAGCARAHANGGRLSWWSGSNAIVARAAILIETGMSAVSAGYPIDHSIPISFLCLLIFNTRFNTLKWANNGKAHEWRHGLADDGINVPSERAETLDSI